jgi:hypothetical protein
MKKFILLIFVLIFTACSDNTIIGNWKTSDRSAVIKDISFENDKYVVMGMHIKCSYEIGNDKVIVTDMTGIGSEWKILNKDTISVYEPFSRKEIIYKRY